MKHLLLSILFLLASNVVHAQMKMHEITYDSIFCYEKRAERLCIRAYIKLTEYSNQTLQLSFGETPLTPVKVTANGIAEVWLPLIGEEGTLLIFTGKQKKVLVHQQYTPLIPSDWGYFKNGTIHIISSSHQDIAWVNSAEICRHGRIHQIIEPAMKMIDDDPDYAFGMEQALNLMEYLEVYPEKKKKVMENYHNGRFVWGATFNQPYEGLESGEQLIRQAYYGRKWIKENLPGCDDVTAYNVDIPGRSMQVPQIFAKSGIKNLFVSRMREGLYDWYSPDGSKILTYTPSNYGWAVLYWQFFNKDAITAFHKLHHRTVLWSDYYKRHNIPPHYAIVISYDAEKPVNYKKVIDDWNKIVSMAEVPLPHLQHSTAESFLNMVNVSDADFEKVVGERPNLWLYIHGPAHYQAIKAKREAGVILPAAETFTTIDKLLEDSLRTYPTEQFDSAWISSIYPDHGWGGNFGEETDSIFRDKLEKARDMGTAMLNKTLISLACKIDVKQNAVVVFNDLPWKRSGIASIVIDSAETRQCIIKDSKGRIVPSQVQKDKIYFEIKDIPSIGYQTYYLSRGKQRRALPENIKQSANYYENKFYRISFGNGGIQSLIDKQLHKEILNTIRYKGGDVLNLEYKGNGAGEFTQITGFTPGDLKVLSSNQTVWSVIDTGPLFTVFRNEQTVKEGSVIQEIRIFHNDKKIDFDVEIDYDGTHNRQLRIAFPLNMTQATVNYEVPMAILQVGKDEMRGSPGGWSWWGTYTQEPKEIHPREVQNFISANGSGYGVTLASGVAVADWIDPAVEGSDFPVLQGVLLSSHKSCHGLGNWYHQKGKHRFSFSLLSHRQGWENGYQFGIEANHPFLTAIKTNKGGLLSDSNSFITTSNPFVAVSIMKKADNDNGVILRLAEMQGRDAEVKITLPFEVKKVIKTNMIEEEMEVVDTKGKNINLFLGHHAIETFKLIF